MKKITFFSALLLILLVSCNPIRPEPRPYPYHEIRFPDEPLNLKDFNTIYDDYNSILPVVSEAVPLCFSSNRNSQGADFDIIYLPLYYSFDYETGEFSVSTQGHDDYGVIYLSSTLEYALQKINSPQNEFGPYILPRGVLTTPDGRDYQAYIFLYSSNKDGNQEIYFTHNFLDEKFENPVKVDFLNSSANDYYPTFNQDFTRMYFSSDREGPANIFRVDTDPNTTGGLTGLLQDNNKTPVKDSILSSPYDDKCPYIHGNLLVFASNRPGGLGGYDLYYSVWKNGQWSEPVNFGDKINTPYDEFRPVITEAPEYENYMMVFSSNRPGGKGGFDLYLVGVDKLE